MTDNEKAATFIGWKPQIGTIVTGATGPYVQQWEYAAPDMADPRNYMKALEGLAPQYIWHLGRYIQGGRYCRILMDEKHPFQTIEKRTVIEALAALYDAEHIAGARQSQEKQGYDRPI